MTYCQSRVAMLLALPPLTVAVFCISGSLRLPPMLGLNTVDEMQLGSFVATLVFGGLWWATWWPLIHRDFPRIAATLALTALLIGQVLFWQPMWHSSGCAQDDILRCAQSLTDLGLWCLGFSLTWWGGRRWCEIRRQSKTLQFTLAKGRHVMTPSAVRLAVGFALMPLLPGVFFIVAQALNQFSPLTSREFEACAYAVCAVLAIGIWSLVWRKSVVWNLRRRVRTSLLVVWMLAAPFAPLVPECGIKWIDMIVLMSPYLALAAWFAGTAFVWRMTPGEMPVAIRIRAAASENAGGDHQTDDDTTSVPCGNCDYDLRGLREARCPECGWTTTLDALVQRSLAATLAAGD